MAEETSTRVNTEIPFLQEGDSRTRQYGDLDKRTTYLLTPVRPDSLNLRDILVSNYDNKVLACDQIDIYSVFKQSGIKDTSPPNASSFEREIFYAINLLRVYPSLAVEILEDWLRLIEDGTVAIGSTVYEMKENTKAIEEAITQVK